MRTRLFFVSLVITVSSIACAQSHRLTGPRLCEKPKSASPKPEGSVNCEIDVLTEYAKKLRISIEILVPPPLPYLPPVPPVPPFPERSPAFDSQQLQWAEMQRDYEEKLESVIVDERLVLNGAAEPLPIEGDNIYLDENQQDTYGEFAKKEGTEIAYLAKSVGRLEIKFKANTGNGIETRYSQWGTGFLLGNNVVATTCHVLESLVVNDNGQWRLKNLEDQGETLVVDFGDKDDHFEREQQYEVSLLGLAETKGLDIALLKIKNDGSHPNIRKGIKLGRASVHPPQSAREVVVVGYPDFHHPLDPHSEAAYRPYKTQGDAKFALLGCATDSTSIKSCVSETPFFLHTSPTTMGESGSILIDRATGQVIGMHTCCSYPEKDDDTAPESDLDCAKLKRTEANQAINICSMFDDHSLAPKLKDNGITAETWGCSKK